LVSLLFFLLLSFFLLALRIYSSSCTQLQLSIEAIDKMRLHILSTLLFGLVASNPIVAEREIVERDVVTEHDVVVVYKNCKVVTPQVFIISMVPSLSPLIHLFSNPQPQFGPEADVWYKENDNPSGIGNLFAQNITVPGFSPLFPAAHCTANGQVCQLTTGESEINAASTITALVHSPLFNLTKTYFMIGGIAGINPKYGTLADVAFCKYAIQVALQYEFDAREIPSNFSTGYVPQGAYSPEEYPQSIYGTEVFEVNEALRDIAAGFALSATLNDSTEAIAYRANYANDGVTLYKNATLKPSIRKCDVATSDVYFSGTLLGEAFENTTSLFTNGSGIYCMTAQEDNATLEAMIRAALSGLLDFSRIIVMRTASDFDRPYPGLSDLDNLFYVQQGGFAPAIANIFLAGKEVVNGIIRAWHSTFEAGIKPTNYIGDIFGSLGGVPDFGPGVVVEPQVLGTEKRDGEVGSRGEMYRKGLGGRAVKGLQGAEVARRAQGNV
jgi:purine nucleoside permease